MRAVLIAAVAAVLAACSGAQTKYGAAEDVRAFIVAVRENDRAAFERHLDRPRLREHLLPQVRSAVGDSMGPFGDAMAAQAVDAIIQPEGFRFALERAGAPARTPTAAEIATQLRVVDDGAVCLPRSSSGPCLATFAESGGVWKLVAIDAGDIRNGLGVPSPPTRSPPG